MAVDCLPKLINVALEGGSTCFAVCSDDAKISRQNVYEKSGLLPTCINWLFDLIDTFRASHSNVRFSVRLSAIAMTNNGKTSSNSNNSSEPSTTDLLESIAQGNFPFSICLFPADFHPHLLFAVLII